MLRLPLMSAVLSAAVLAGIALPRDVKAEAQLAPILTPDFLDRPAKATPRGSQHPAAAAVLSGIASVKDGDGLLFGEIEIRIKGIAAPEDNRSKTEPGGRAASHNLRTLAQGKKVVCQLDGSVTSGRSAKRPVGTCFVNDLDLGKAQVLAGHARDCPRFSKGFYRAAELSARADGNDLSATYELPRYCRQR